MKFKTAILVFAGIISHVPTQGAQSPSPTIQILWPDFDLTVFEGAAKTWELRAQVTAAPNPNLSALTCSVRIGTFPQISAKPTSRTSGEVRFSVTYSFDGIAPGSYDAVVACVLPSLNAPAAASIRRQMIVLPARVTALQGTVTSAVGNADSQRDWPVATEVAFLLPTDLAGDAAGNLYVTDRTAHVVARISADGRFSVIAGNGIQGASGEGGPARNASLDNPDWVALDPAGIIYIVDRLRVRRVGLDGTISTIAGGGTITPSDADVGRRAGELSLTGLRGVAAEESGHVYFGSNSGVYRLKPDGVVDQVIAQSSHGGMVLDSSGALYFGCGTSNTLCIWRPTGTLDTQAVPVRLPVLTRGLDGLFYSLDQNQTTLRVFDSKFQLVSTRPQNRQTRGVFANASGTVFTVNYGVRGILQQNGDSGSPRLVAGGLPSRYGGDGGHSLAARLDKPRGMATDRSGRMYLADTSNHRIRLVDLDGSIRTIAGTGMPGYDGDGGPATSARISNPTQVVVDSRGVIYFNDDSWTGGFRRLALDGTISTVRIGVLGGMPAGLSLDRNDNLYLAAKDRILRVTPDNRVTVIAGTGANTGTDADGRIDARAIAIDEGGDIYFSEDSAFGSALGVRIRRLRADGTIITAAGGSTETACRDRVPAIETCLNKMVLGTAEGLLYETGVSMAFGLDGHLYFPDIQNHQIRRLRKDGLIETVGGMGTRGGSGDGRPALEAEFNRPSGVAFDAAGDLLIADSWNHKVRRVSKTVPTVSVLSEKLQLSAIAGGATPAPRSLVLNSSTSGIPFQVEAEGDWLRVTPTTGQLSSNIRIGAEIADMAAGIYTGKVRIRTPNATPAEQTLEVHLELTSPPLAPRLATGPEEVAFSASASDSTGQQSIQIRNTGGGELRYLLETGVPWLRLSSGEGTVTAAAATAVTITADATGLAPGNYSGRITVRNLGDGTTAEISVRLAVTGLQPSLLLSQSGLSFQGEVGPAAEFPHYVAVLNSGDGRMTWTAQARTNSGENWIRVEPAAGTSEGNAGTLPELKIWVNATNLAPGNYKGFVDVTAAGAQNSPRSIEVQLKVIPAGGRPRPIVTRSGVVFVVRPGQTAPKSEVTGLWNVLTDTLQWNTSSAAFGPLWFSVSPSNGAVTSSKDQAVLIVPDLVGAQPGIYDGAVTVIMKTSKWGAETPRAVQVLGVVARPGAAGAPAITKTGLRQAESACVATRLVALVTTLGDAYQATVNVPVPIEVRAVDDCGEPLRNGTALATFSQDDSPLPLVSLRDGRWTGTWFPKRANESVELTVELRSADRKLGASVAVSGTVGNP